MAPGLRFVAPHRRYRGAFLRCARDHVEHGDDAERAREYVRALDDFDAYVAQLRHCASCDEPGPGLVQQHNFWLIDASDIVGHLRLRPRLNERLHWIGGNIGYDVPPSRRGRGYATRMLAMGVLEAASRGLDRVLLTADATNAASIKVIERNGGRFDREYEFEGAVRRRYWIDCPSPALRRG